MQEGKTTSYSGQGIEGSNEGSSTSEKWPRRQSDFLYLSKGYSEKKSEVKKSAYVSNEKYVNFVEEAEPMYEKIIVNGKEINLEIDTGTYATIISEKMYNENFREFQICKTGTHLKAYDGKVIQPMGKMNNVTVNFKGKTCVLDCYILPGLGPGLLGRKWLAAFGVWPLKLNENSTHDFNNLKIENIAAKIEAKFKDLFSDSPGVYNKSKSKLYLKDSARPIALKCRQVAHALKPLIEEEINRLVKLGHLKPIEISEWATPIVPVFKSNGNIRICGDFSTTVNPNLIIDKYPLHTIDDIFNVLQGGNTFTELDLTHAYMQFPVDEDTSKLLTIVTHKGLFQYTKIPEGVSPAPADIQRKMDECLRGIDGVITYIDNIYVTGKTDEEHVENLRKVCMRLQECGLKLNKGKCKFLQEKLEVLGFVINKEGLHKAKSKVTAMVNAPQPEDNNQLASFLGLINFYARFLEKRSEKLKPLYDLLNKEKFEWNDECSRAFNWVKDEMISEKVLVNYDAKRKVILACDASDYGLSAILSHQYEDGSERPIAFASRKIAKNELNRKILDKEAMAIILGVKRFYQFLFGREFLLRTDNKALGLILGPRKGIPVTADNRLQRWAYFLSGFRYTVEHVKSEANANADALSRLPIDDDTEMIDVDFSNVNFFEEGVTTINSKMLAAESKKDKLISTAINHVMGSWPHLSKDFTNDEKSLYNKRLEFTVEKGCLF